MSAARADTSATFVLISRLRYVKKLTEVCTYAVQ